MSTQIKQAVQRLHLGCGRNVLPGWVNLDVVPLQGVDVVADLDDCPNARLPFDDGAFDAFLGNHLLEHIRHSLPLMQELHRIAKPGARAIFNVPYGSSDDAFEDPTHVRQYFVTSFGYFSQPFYWRADYAYRGDWQPEKVILKVSEKEHKAQTAEQIFGEVMSRRNVVLEMTAELVAVKPIREPKKELQMPPNIEITLT